MERHQEREQTFDVDDAFCLGELLSPLARGGATVGEAEVEHLRATYYDTEDLALLHAGITLRRRVGGHDAGWHLKLPADAPGERTELRLPLESSSDAVPPELVDLLTAPLRGRGLRPVLALQTDRTARVVRRGDSGGVELADDRVVAERLIDGGVEAWREIEVEWLGADGELASSAARLLERAGARPAAIGSKAARALGVTPGTPGSGTGGTRQPGQVLPAQLEALFGEVIRQDLAFRQGRLEAVHDLRVAIRRLRSLLRTFKPLLEKRALEPVVRELAWLGGVLGTAREREVLAAHTERALDALAPEERLGPVRAALAGPLAGAAAAARDEVRAALGTPRYAQLLVALAEIAARPPVRERVRARALRRCVRRELRGAIATWQSALRTRGPGRDGAIHEARKAAKRVRYAAETIAPLAPKAAARFAAGFRSLQEVLGERHDAVVARAHYAREGARAGVRPGENGFTYGILAERERAAIAELDAALPRLWRRAGRRRLRRFLD